ncbi:MAG: ATP-binding cassette domain-containing protein, partial [Pseudomonadota bacterium]|nr:ATP-binding cassette domain-containing protein [Pseudomonadota bacterium]
MLKIEKLNQFYGESHTLWDLELDVPQGQCTCVMGRNGVGKTTLMKCIMGEETVKSGAIEFAQDVELTKKKIEDRSRLGIGYVPQGRQIFPLLTVEENLRTGLAVRADGSKQIPER